MANKVKTGLFQRLNRVFSTDVIIRNVGGNKINTVDINKIQNSQNIRTNSLVGRYNNMSMNNSSLYGRHLQQQFQYLRPQLYSEYDLMDTNPIIASALDIIADECSLKNEMDKVLTVQSSNEEIYEHLENLFYDVLNIEFNLWAWSRQMCKYGDFFLKLEIAEKFGVYNVIPYTSYNISRHEGFDEENPHSVKFDYHPNGIVGGDGISNGREGQVSFKNYEMAHFRLIADVSYLPYGRSYLEPARTLYKQYSLMEEAMLVHRITRAPEKRIYYVNVAGIPADEIEGFMQDTMSRLKRDPHQDPKTGQYNLRYNLANMLEDMYIPTRGDGQHTKVDTAPGLQYDGIKDVEYLRDHLFAALKVPKAFLGFEADLEGKATLASEDIRFGRTIDRIQRILTSELNKIAIVHLYSLGFRDEDLVNFDLKLTTPSIIYEQEKIELFKAKSEAAESLLTNKIVPKSWIYENIFNFSEEQVNSYRNQLLYDAKEEFRLTQVGEEGNDPFESGKSYGTPHDLASLYGKGRTTSDPSNVPEGYGDDLTLGRPLDKTTKRNKQEDNLGKDRLGVKGMKDVKNANEIKKKNNSKKPILNHSLEKSLERYQPGKSTKLIITEDEKKDDYKNTMLDDSKLED